MSKELLNTLPEDGFSFIDREIEITDHTINLSIGNPIDPPDEGLIRKLCMYIQDNNLHGYGFTYKDTQKEIQNSIVNYYNNRFGVILNPRNEVEVLNGTKEGIFCLLSSMINEGDKVLVPSPSYSVYMNCIHLAGGRVVEFPCYEDNFIPNISSIDKNDLEEASVIILCSPGNPTTKILPEDFLIEVVELAKKYDLKIIHDIAYGELCYGKNDITSILQISDAINVSVELYSLSKSCNVAGWRLGFALGNEKIISNLKKIKYNIDFGTFVPFQKVAIDMINNMQVYSYFQTKVYEERVDYFVEALNRLGWKIKKPEGTFFIWTKIPEKYAYMSDKEFVKFLYDKTNVLILPGSGFGDGGKGYVRIALTNNMEIIKKAVSNLEKLLLQEDNLLVSST